MYVNVTEKLPGSGRTEDTIMETSLNSLGKERELQWMFKLHTVYPYGLNDKIVDEL